LIVTNKNNLPEPLVRAFKVLNSKYVGGGNVSVTTLKDSPQIHKLRTIFKDYVTVDAESMLYSVLGQAMHQVLESANERVNEDKDVPDVIEKRFYKKFLGWELSGQVDRLIPQEEKISDWKMTSTWKVMNKKFDDWEKQLNCYAHLARSNGYKVSNLEIVAVLRDYKKNSQSVNYPESPIQVIDIPVWEDKKVEEYITERIKLHKSVITEKKEYVCTNEDRWYTGDKWALIKKGNKKATKIFRTKEEAGEIGKEYKLEFRKGTSLRCENYCEVSNFCKQYKEEKEKDERG
tara:strand:- start:9059 stop:9928 length:870 start_codon:yes stop_codon:yes gene_type:complete